MNNGDKKFKNERNNIDNIHRNKRTNTESQPHTLTYTRK